MSYARSSAVVGNEISELGRALDCRFVNRQRTSLMPRKHRHSIDAGDVTP
jgi:hypothetical protein